MSLFSKADITRVGGEWLVTIEVAEGNQPTLHEYFTTRQEAEAYCDGVRDVCRSLVAVFAMIKC